MSTSQVHMYVQCRLGALGYRYSGSAGTYNCFLLVVKFVLLYQSYPPPPHPPPPHPPPPPPPLVRCQDLRINILYSILLLSLTTYFCSQECLTVCRQTSSQKSSSQESSSQESSNQESSNQEPSSSAATDLGQPRTWSSHGPGAATDMEQPRTWSSYSLGPVKEGR